MGFIPENQIAELKSRLDIVDVTSQYVTLKRAGSNYKGLCPFHNEKTPSFSVSPQRNSYRCFGCGEAGDSISFIMKMENLEYIEAIRFLADKMGITLDETEYSHSKVSKLNRMYEINSIAAKYYMKNLLTDDFPQNYIKNRGLQNKILSRFFLGYAKSTPGDLPNDDLISYMETKDVSKDELVEIGLADKYNGRYYDKFVDRLIFPILNNKNKVIGFGGRTLANHKAKYLNSKESEVFIKGKNAYGVHIINKARNQNKVILVEGYMDVIGLYNNGIDFALATLGTALTQDQANLIKRYGKEIYIAYDGDEAGIRATLKAIEIFKNMDVNLGIVEFPEELDPDEFIIKYGREKFDELLKNATDPIDFKLQKLYDSKPNKMEFINEIINFLSDIQGNVVRDLYIDKSARFIGVTTDSLREDVIKRIEENNKKQGFKRTTSNQTSNNGYNSHISQKTEKPSKNSDGKSDLLQVEFLIYSLVDKENFNKLMDYVSMLRNDELKSLYSKIVSYHAGEINIENIIESPIARDYKIKQKYYSAKSIDNYDEIINEIIERIEKKILLEKKIKLERKVKSGSATDEEFIELTTILRKLT